MIRASLSELDVIQNIWYLTQFILCVFGACELRIGFEKSSKSIGRKEHKSYKTVIHASAADFDTIIFSGGKIGYQVELSLDDLKQVLWFDCDELLFRKK